MFRFHIVWIKSPECLIYVGLTVPEKGVRIFAIALANLWSAQLRSDQTHLKHSGDFNQRARNIDMEHKVMESLDIKLLCTNIPVTKCHNILRK